MGTIVVFKQELGIYPWTIHMLNSSLRKKNAEIHLHTASALQKYNQVWSFAQGQLLKKWYQGDKRTHGHFKTQIVLLTVYAVFHRLCRPIGRVSEFNIPWKVFPHFNNLWTTICPSHQQARRQDLAARGVKNQKGGPKTRMEATFLKYSIGCMQQPGGQTWNGGKPISNGGSATTDPPLATALPTNDGSDVDLFLLLTFCQTFWFYQLVVPLLGHWPYVFQHLCGIAAMSIWNLFLF